MFGLDPHILWSGVLIQQIFFLIVYVIDNICSITSALVILNTPTSTGV